MIYLFSFITHAKSSKIILLGEPDISSPLAFAEGLFCFYKYFYIKRRIFKLNYRIIIKIANLVELRFLF
jgi:hypothetical protein